MRGSKGVRRLPKTTWPSHSSMVRASYPTTGQAPMITWFCDRKKGFLCLWAFAWILQGPTPVPSNPSSHSSLAIGCEYGRIKETLGQGFRTSLPRSAKKKVKAHGYGHTTKSGLAGGVLQMNQPAMD